MRSFQFHQASTIKDALFQLREKGRQAKILAGGTDLLGEIKDGIISPGLLVSIRDIPGLDRISLGSGELRMGPLVSLHEIAAHPRIEKQFGALAQAASEVGSPQLRHMGTLGGNLCQRPRCWYYRGEQVCLKKGGKQCYAPTGQNKYHAILDGGPCFMVHPSDTAPALLALRARVKIAGLQGQRVIPLGKFFISPRQDVRRETVLDPGEVLTEIQVPSIKESRSVYLKTKERRCWDFALASVAVALTFEDGLCREARIVLGGVAPFPYRASKAEEILKEKRIEEPLATQASHLALLGALPLTSNAYKVDLARALVRRALLAAASD
ncbi:MAG: FAD binding domain-containing protein [Candidatus Binatia bacterium]